ncbi:HEPN domain-containing protein [Pseudoflavitalea rhizosphaerae]|uniref:HEPN domain-containing protein n=1 Tax=Pseudoflavitalea rhizosphaerae TaxID=1884793 RepID=UPI000F8F7BC5|nr:HEPN domain-containing protein [Pseudoflavitalea rhizosphaerae]
MNLIHSLEIIPGKIVNAISPDKIIVLGYIDKHRRRFSIFDNSFTEINYPEEINLLVIADCSNIDRSNVLDMLEQRCKALCRLTIIWLSPAAFNNQLEQNTPFAIRALQSGTILYQKWQPADHIQTAINKKTETQVDKSELFPWYERSQIFSQMAGVQFRFGNYGMAAFCIHQAVEQLLIMLFMNITGFRYGLHNLDRMLCILRFHNDEAANVFSKETSQGRDRLFILRKIYISYRYHSDVIISKDDIDYFFCELNKLQQMADRVFYSKRYLGTEIY